MPQQIFISLTKQDHDIALGLRDALRMLLGDSLKVSFSTNKELEGGIRHGQDWFEWIVEQVQKCDFALILITPASVQKPWILWEAGAVHGAAIASGKGDLRKVRPLVYQLDSAQLPSPIRDSKAQFRRGDRADEVESLFTEILDQYRDDIPTDRFKVAFRNLDGAIKTYLQLVNTSLLKAPALPTTEVVEEWRIRLDDLLRSKRASEAEHLHDWMDIAFGRGADDKGQPLDLRIHSRLADLYLKSRKYPKAIDQLSLARKLGPRDIYVLRRLGKAYLENGDRDLAKEVIDRIKELDKNAVVHNAECAALAGRWYREGGNLAMAEEIFSAALDADPESHYLANLLGEVRLEAGRRDSAGEAFKRSLDIIERLRETNIWTLADAANAAFFVGEDEKAAGYLRTLAQGKPDAGVLATIEGGLRRLATHLDQGNERVLILLGAIRG
jgi:tetratricopeptide (TPR) repeat protein